MINNTHETGLVVPRLADFVTYSEQVRKNANAKNSGQIKISDTAHAGLIMLLHLDESLDSILSFKSAAEVSEFFFGVRLTSKVEIIDHLMTEQDRFGKNVMDQYFSSMFNPKKVSDVEVTRNFQAALGELESFQHHLESIANDLFSEDKLGADFTDFADRQSQIQKFVGDSTPLDPELRKLRASGKGFDLVTIVDQSQFADPDKFNTRFAFYTTEVKTDIQHGSFNAKVRGKTVTMLGSDFLRKFNSLRGTFQAYANAFPSFAGSPSRISNGVLKDLTNEISDVYERHIRIAMMQAPDPNAYYDQSHAFTNLNTVHFQGFDVHVADEGIEFIEKPITFDKTTNPPTSRMGTSGNEADGQFTIPSRTGGNSLPTSSGTRPQR